MQPPDLGQFHHPAEFASLRRSRLRRIAHHDAVEVATLEWVDWLDRHRLLEPLGDVPPVEFEAAYHRAQESPAMGAELQ